MYINNDQKNKYFCLNLINRHRNIILSTACILFLLIACGNISDRSVVQEKSDSYSQKVSQSNTKNSCFENYYGKPEELLTKELVGTFIEFEGADVEIAKVSEQIIRDKDFAQVNCKWKINGQRQIVRLKQISKIELYESESFVDRC